MKNFSKKYNTKSYIINHLLHHYLGARLSGGSWQSRWKVEGHEEQGTSSSSPPVPPPHTAHSVSCSITSAMPSSSSFCQHQINSFKTPECHLSEDASNVDMLVYFWCTIWLLVCGTKCTTGGQTTPRWCTGCGAFCVTDKQKYRASKVNKLTFGYETNFKETAQKVKG